MSAQPMLPADRDGSGRPCFSARQMDTLAGMESDLECLPSFFIEAMTEFGDQPAMGEAMRTGDAIAFMREVRKASAKYREFCTNQPEYDEDDHQCLARLLEAYA